MRTVHSRGYRFVANVMVRNGDSDTPLPTILVRLFRAPSEIDEIAYLAAGLTADLIASLSHASLSG